MGLIGHYSTVYKTIIYEAEKEGMWEVGIEGEGKREVERLRE